MLSGHKEAITSVAIHPSGKLALSVSKDNTLKLWNLVQGTMQYYIFTQSRLPLTSRVIVMRSPGRCSFTRRLRGAAEKVLWSPSGEYYLLTVQMEVQVSHWNIYQQLYDFHLKFLSCLCRFIVLPIMFARRQ